MPLRGVGATTMRSIWEVPRPARSSGARHRRRPGRWGEVGGCQACLRAHLVREQGGCEPVDEQSQIGVAVRCAFGRRRLAHTSLGCKMSSPRARSKTPSGHIGRQDLRREVSKPNTRARQRATRVSATQRTSSKKTWPPASAPISTSRRTDQHQRAHRTAPAKVASHRAPRTPSGPRAGPRAPRAPAATGLPGPLRWPPRE